MSMSESTRNTAAERPLSRFLPVAIVAIAGRMSVVLPGRVLLSVCAVCLFVSCDKAPEPRLPVSRLTLSQPCDVRQGCRVADESVAVTVIFDAEPRALQSFPIRVQFDGHQQADAVTVAFSMQGMDMGSNRYRLIADALGGWSAEIILPICTSGRTDWVADFELVVADRRLQIQVPFVLEK